MWEGELDCYPHIPATMELLKDYKGEVIIPAKERLSVLEQNQEKYNDQTVLKTVLMGHKRLVEIMDEREMYFAKTS